MKKLLIQGFVAGVLAALTGVIYFEIYQNLMLTEFNAVVNHSAIVGSSIIGCLLMTLGYWGLLKIKKMQFVGILNILIGILSFVSIIGIFSTALPLDIKNPELFPGLVVPMHFFPALSFLAVEPWFRIKD
jgi:hypothetical protein